MRILLALLLILLPINSYAFTAGNILEYLNQQNTQDSGVTLGTMTDTKYCTYSASGTKIVCNSTGGGGLTVGTTTITSGTNGKIEYNNSGTLGELASNAVGGMSLVASATPSAVSSFTFSSLTAGTRYLLILNLILNTSNASSELQFNSDSGTNYEWGGFSVPPNGTPGGNGATSANYIQFAVRGIASGRTMSSTIYFQSIQGTDSTVSAWGNGQYYSSGDSHYEANGFGGIYVGASTLTSVTIGVSAGTITGTASLYQLN